MKFETNEQSKDTIDQIEKKIQERIKERVDLDFSNGERKLYRDVLNFWIMGGDYLKKIPKKELKEYFDLLKPMLHYRQGYLEKGKKDVENIRRVSGNEKAEFYEVCYPRELDRIMELSDPEQIIKYNKLVDHFNNNLKRIKKEFDIDCLESYYNKAIKIIDGEK